MENPYVIGIISWFLPGFGHLMQRHFIRGTIIGVAIWSMFIIAIFSGGAYYPGFEFKDGSLLFLLNVFAKLGNGLGALIGLLVSGNPPSKVASWATFEYGGRFLEIAGLLNYLALLDAVDISFGRKK